MQFSTIFLAAAAATLASAVQLTNPSFEVAAGTPFNITWSDADGPVTLLLKNGPSTSLSTVSTIGSGLTGTSFSWTPPATLDSSLYAIEIQDSTDTNYSQQFQVSGATAVASTVTASSTSASSSGTASSTSGSSTASSTSESSSSTSSSASSSSSSSSTASRNSTSTSSSSSASRTSSTTISSRTSSSTSSAGTSTATSAPTSAAAEFSSPLAFVFLAFAAIVTLN